MVPTHNIEADWQVSVGWCGRVSCVGRLLYSTIAISHMRLSVDAEPEIRIRPRGITLLWVSSSKRITVVRKVGMVHEYGCR